MSVNTLSRSVKELLEVCALITTWFKNPDEFLKPGDWDAAVATVQPEINNLPAIAKKITAAFTALDTANVKDKAKAAEMVVNVIRQMESKIKVASVPVETGDDFWGNLTKTAEWSQNTDTVDTYLSGKAIGGDTFKSMQQLANGHQEGLVLPVAAGARVAFVGSLGAVMTYSDPPAPKSMGTVVTVRTATGDVTEHNGSVFVEWDDGKTRAIHATHLTLSKGVRKTQKSGQIRVASLGDLTEFMRMGSSSDTLIHKSTRDLWSMHQDGSGFIIERLFDDVGKPLKA